MYWIGVLLATIGATLILGALAFVSTLIGVLINAMIVLVSGPLIDRAAGPSRRQPPRASSSPPPGLGLGRGGRAHGGLVVDLETAQQLPQPPHLHLQPPTPPGHRCS